MGQILEPIVAPQSKSLSIPAATSVSGDWECDPTVSPLLLHPAVSPFMFLQLPFPDVSVLSFAYCLYLFPPASDCLSSPSCVSTCVSVCSGFKLPPIGSSLPSLEAFQRVFIVLWFWLVFHSPFSWFLMSALFARLWLPVCVWPCLDSGFKESAVWTKPSWLDSLPFAHGSFHQVVYISTVCISTQYWWCGTLAR